MGGRDQTQGLRVAEELFRCCAVIIGSFFGLLESHHMLILKFSCLKLRAADAPIDEDHGCHFPSLHFRHRSRGALGSGMCFSSGSLRIMVAIIYTEPVALLPQGAAGGAGRPAAGPPLAGCAAAGGALRGGRSRALGVAAERAGHDPV